MSSEAGSGNPKTFVPAALGVAAADGARSLGIGARDRSELIAAIKDGLPVGSLDLVAEALDLLPSTVAGAVGIPGRTLTRRRREGRLSAAESERLYRVSRLLEHAETLLGTRVAARRWLESPKLALGGRTPLEYADSEPGADEVADLIVRLEHGVFS